METCFIFRKDWFADLKNGSEAKRRAESKKGGDVGQAERSTDDGISLLSSVDPSRCTPNNIF
jgi:hypothetical protein